MIFRRKKNDVCQSLRVCICGDHDCSDCVHAHEDIRYNGDIVCMPMTNLFQLSTPKVVYDSRNKVWHRWNTCVGYKKYERKWKR